MVTADIDIWRLVVFYLFLLIPIFLMYYLKAELIKELVVSVFRMSVQLALLGLYLGWLFEYNSLLLNIFWIVIMVTVAAGHIIRSSNLKRRGLFLHALFAVAFALFIILTPLILVVVRPEPYYAARYLVPLGGMLLGNFLSMNIIALQHYSRALSDNKQYIQSALCFGATNAEATLPFFREAFVRSLTPTITRVGTLGIISLPGMLTGQLLGGSIPAVAIKYQIIIMLAIIVSGSMSIFFTLWLVTRKIFDKYGNIRHELYRD